MVKISRLVEWQIYGINRQGGLVHAGVRKARTFSRSLAQRDQDAWERFAAVVAAVSGDCPTASVRGTVVYYRVFPIDSPSKGKDIPVKAVALMLPWGVIHSKKFIKAKKDYLAGKLPNSIKTLVSMFGKRAVPRVPEEEGK